ncbi:MAG TPA: hypothetical protein ENK28_06190 [Aliiroseovarius sp.]|nr:hypothetical protein [Aliiroseovarius sp.]
MITRILAMTLTVATAPALAQETPVTPTAPSGQDISLYDIAAQEGYEALIYHFRFLWPGIVDTDLEQAAPMIEADMAFFCNQVAIPRLAEAGAEAERVVISFSDREVEFGVATPEATQIFESYVIHDTTCEWEPF